MNYRHMFIAVPLSLFALAGCAAQERVVAPATADACRGVPDEYRGAHFIHALGVEQVEPLREDRPLGRVPRKLTVGTQLVVPAQEGMSKEYLERIVACHASDPQPGDPLELPGVTAEVRSISGGYAVVLRGDGMDQGRALHQRAVASARSAPGMQPALAESSDAGAKVD